MDSDSFMLEQSLSEIKYHEKWLKTLFSYLKEHPEDVSTLSAVNDSTDRLRILNKRPEVVSYFSQLKKKS